MNEIRVWAPVARHLEVVAGERRTPMTAVGNGWYAAPATSAAEDRRYHLSVDGSDPVTDPRTASQPEGINGPSELVDHEAFPWTDGDWRGLPLTDAVIYELHTGTFSEAGTFDGIVEKIPHLRNLGVNTVEIMPVATFPGKRGWGYDGVNLYAPHQQYGGPEALKRLVDACHGAGIAVVMDVVYNHLGPDGNHLGEFGPYFTDVYKTPWGAALNFDDRGSDEVRQFFIENALMWLRDYHCDGLRLDAVQAIIDTSALQFLENVTVAVRELEAERGRAFWLIAESDLNDPRIVSPRDRGGYGFDAQWSDDFHHALHAVLTGERNGYYEDFGPLADLVTALRQAFVYDGRYSRHRGRSHGRRPVGLPGTAFLGYIQDHDQVGNRARGERISQLVSPGLCRVAATLVLTSPFTPLLFAGEEWGAATPFLYFTDHDSAWLGRAVTEGRRREFAAFGWPSREVPDPQAATTFEASRLRWGELQNEPHATTLRWYRDLLRLRAQDAALRDGRMDTVELDFDEASRWLVMRRGATSVFCNFGTTPVSLPAAGDLVLASEPGARVNQGRVELPAESAAVLRLG